MLNSTPLTAYGIPDDATLAVMERNSFTDQVAHRLQARQPGLRAQYYKSIPAAHAEGMQQGQYVLLPFENSGSDPSVVWPYLDLIENDPTLTISAEVHHNVDMCVGGVSGTDLRDVHAVYTHPKAMQQSSRYLNQTLGISQSVAEDSTVAGLEHIARKKLQRAIGLGTKEAINAAGLVVLDSGVTNLPAGMNITQFFVVHKNGGRVEPNFEASRHAALLRMPSGGPGTLLKPLTVLRDGGVNLTSLHSRAEDPHAKSPTAQNEFFIEMVRRGDPAALRSVLTGIQQIPGCELRWLGSWDDVLEPQLEAPPVSESAYGRQLRVDFNRQYHRILLDPFNEPGVLCDILELIARARVDIVQFQSRNIGPKQYLFDVTLNKETAYSDMHVQSMVADLYASRAIKGLQSVGSNNNLQELRETRLTFFNAP